MCVQEEQEEVPHFIHQKLKQTEARFWMFLTFPLMYLYPLGHTKVVRKINSTQSLTTI